MKDDYKAYSRHLVARTQDLKKAVPGPVEGFIALHKGVMTDGALPRKMKELIALGIAIHAQCDGCIAAHVGGAVRSGATREEILDAVGVALLMGGGPASVYAVHAFDALDQYAPAE